MPHDIYRACDKAEEEKADEDSGCGSFSERELFREEVAGNEYYREKAAVNEGPALGSHGIVGAGIELRQKVEDVKLLTQ